MAMLQILKNLDYDSLPISDYSRNYILRLLPNLDYYLDYSTHFASPFAAIII